MFNHSTTLLALMGALCLGGCALGPSKPNSLSTVAPGKVLPNSYTTRTEPIRLLSWNVEHFVDEYDDPYIENDREDEPDAAMVERTVLLAKALRTINADIVVLQEFESENFARQIAEKYLEDLNYEYFSASESPTWYMNVVVMSRIPLGVHYSYKNVFTPVVGQTNEDGTPAQQSNINTRMWAVDVIPNEEYVFTLTGVHLKAGGGDRNAAMRTGQYDFLKGQFQRFLNERPEANLLMVGDFNSYPESPELAGFLAPSGRVKLINPTAGKEFLTHPAEEPSRQLDYIIFNNNMAPEITPESVQIAPGVSREDMIKIADHLPLVVEFTPRDK
ncbi:MAG: endonuclease/exonuclease/phosphatase family protein [Candidatus Sumerlaeia bacterium]|nr:endonuclease/exonuclease/phosphatase family protein [Candidatus Sumerlaeia bacterium]